MLFNNFFDQWLVEYALDMLNDLILLIVNQIGSGHDLKERLDCSQNFECIRPYLVNCLVACALKTILSYHAAVLTFN